MSFKPISAIEGTVVLGTTAETRILEFKSEYRWQKVNDNRADRVAQAEELARDVAQFANTDGGTLLIGITERDAGTLAQTSTFEQLQRWA
jgi:predicted HTH transcriptional regulator